MNSPQLHTRADRRRRISLLLVAGASVAGLVATSVPASGQTAENPLADLPAFDEYGFQGEGEARIDDLDARAGSVAPSAAQEAIAASLGATAARWNRFGTPHVLTKHGGYLTGPREGSAVDVARAFVRDNAGLFRLDTAAVDALEVLQDSPLYDSPDLGRVYRDKQPAANPDVAHVVTFRQRLGDLEAALDGQLTVGVQRDGRVAWVTSSVTGDDVVSGEQRLDAAAAVLAAAQDVELDLGTLGAPVADGRFTTFTSDVAKDVQRARLVALPTPQDGVRRAWEVTLLDTALDEHGNPTAFITYVDAESGTIWQRTNKLEHAAQGMSAGSITLPASYAMTPGTRLPKAQSTGSSGSYAGTTEPGACGPLHEFEVGEDIEQITVTALSADNPNTGTVNADLVATIVYKKPDGTTETVASGDTLGNPEAATYAPPADTKPGVYAAQVCNFNSDDPGFDYTGNYVLTPVGTGGDTGGAAGLLNPPTWRVFPANPPFVAGLDPEQVDEASQDTRVLWCWNSRRFPDACAEEQMNTAARAPWDVNPGVGGGTPSFTTDGNFASTAISEASFLTPDTAANRPVSPTREYDYPFGNKWFEKSCAPTFGTVVDDLNDEQASTANLFVMHNRMHDWSYYLGLTEVNSALQKTNFGNTGPERENDPELGSSQAGRRTFNGRDNANQITLPDGVPGVTNQYLWQPLAGAFYAPCVDGAYDMAVVAHEYGHAVSNRMIGGPEGGTGSTQGQTESWSDLLFAAYFTEFGISAGEGINPYVLGPYVTGDPVAGIRNFALNESPLNYSDLDYDSNGLGSPHANGEIWSATNFDILVALNRKYDAQFPSSDKALQVRCAKGDLPADQCPGNRRWNQIQFDSFLIQPSGSSMVDSRDGMLAADMLRFDGANQSELWTAFAHRGLGENAEATGPTDVDSTPSFTSPLRNDTAAVTFTAPAGVSDMEVFVGRFQARAVPIADTVADTAPGETAGFLPGTYEFVARADGYGLQRFTLNLAPGARTVEVPFRRNVASAAHGATATGDGVNLEKLIDDTEMTNWASLESAGTASEGKGEGKQVEGRQVTVDLAGDDPVNVVEVTVSAALRGPPSDEEDLPDPDPGSQSRFSALRSFDLLTCNAATGADCSTDEGFTEIYASADDAFPSRRPRPRIVELVAQPFDVPDTQATHLRLVVRDNQCTGAPDFQGENNPDADPAFNPDCDTEAFSVDREILAPPVELVRASELQVYETASLPPVGDVTAQAREIFDACPEDLVPRHSRADSLGNTHEFAIDCMVWWEIAQGTSDTTYEPSKGVTRAQMASFVARLIEKSGGELEAGEDAFSDDDGQAPHEENINKLAAAGIVNGKSEGVYDPSAVVTRAQMAKFLVEAYEYRSQKNIETPRGDYFGDDNGSVHEANINKSAAAGFTNGRNGGYDPSATVLRDQMASFLARVLDLLVEEGTTPPKEQTATE